MKFTRPKILLGFHGHAGVGKDEAATHLCLTAKDCIRIAFAESLKRACAEAFGLARWDFEGAAKETYHPIWGKTSREIAQYVGTEMFRTHFGPDFWIKRAFLEIERDFAHSVFIFSDVRFQNEYDWIVANGGRIIHITRPGYTGNVGIPNHASEAGLNFTNPEVTYHVNNDSTIQVFQDRIRECVAGMLSFH